MGSVLSDLLCLQAQLLGGVSPCGLCAKVAAPVFIDLHLIGHHVHLLLQLS